MKPLFLVLFGMLLTGASLAQGFPERPVRVVVPFPAGGSADYVVRLLGEKLLTQWGKPLVVEHRPGGGAIIGLQAVAKAQPDGYTLGLVTPSFVIQPAIRRTMPYDVLADFEFLTLVMETPFVLTANGNLPVASMKELVAHAKARPGKLNIGSFGIGSTPHILAEVFGQSAGVDLVHVPFKGSPDATAAQLAGEVPLNFDVVMSPMPHIRQGKLRPIAVTSARRYAGLPETPTVAEAGLPQLEMTAWFGLVAPARTPQNLVLQLNAAIVQALHAPELSAALDKQGMQVITTTPPEFRAFVERSMKRIASATARLPKLD
jgi:tripartite-type tricarboxylate transporter receptor subunit TctC